MPRRNHGEVRPLPPKKSARGFIGVFALLAAALVVWTVWYGFWHTHWHEGWARTAAQVLPFPVASVEGDIIWYGEVSELANRYESLRDLEANEGFSLAASALVDLKHTEHFALELGVNLSDISEVDQEGVEDLLAMTGWNSDEYDQYVAYPQALALAVEQAVYSSQEYQLSARLEIEELYDQINRGVPFIDIAATNSDHLSAAYNGDLGEVGVEDIDLGLRSIFELKADEVSPILETETYFAIVLVEEVFEDEEEGTIVSARIITIDKVGLSEALEVFTRTQDVNVILPGIVLE